MRDLYYENPAKPQQRGNFIITNIVSNFDDLAMSSLTDQLKNSEQSTFTFDYLEATQNQSLTSRIAHYIHITNPIEWIFLFVFSVICSIFIISYDELILASFRKRVHLCQTEYEVLNYLMWVITAVILFLLASSVGYFITPNADGSGIPEMKTVLSGIPIYRYFSFDTLIAKMLGLWAVIAGGPSVGKIGPYVHFSTLISINLMKMKYFSVINNNTSLKTTMLTAAIAAGITLGSGAPLAGVIFSIETTTTVYIVSNMWKAFFSSVICSFVSKMIRSNAGIYLFESDNLNKNVPFGREIIVFGVLGFLCGIIGAMFSTFTAKISYMRRKSTNSWLTDRFKFAALVALFVANVTFFFPILHTSDANLTSFLFSNSLNTNNFNGLKHPYDPIMLFISFILKFCITMICLTVNLPAGLIGTFLATGALLGRSWGHLFNYLFGASHPEIYAMIGAAGVLAGATHTISPALIIFELTGKTSYLAPLLLSTLIANITCQAISMNIFDVVLAMKNLPNIAYIKSSKVYEMKAEDIMSRNFFSMKLSNFNMIDGMEILHKLPKKYKFNIPIINDLGQIEYTILGKNLHKYVKSSFEHVRNDYNINVQSRFDEFFSFIHKKFHSSRNFIQYITDKMRKIYYNINDSEKLKLSRNFEEDANQRLITLFKNTPPNEIAFLNQEIEITSKILNSDYSAFCVDPCFPALKIQFIFTFLNVSHIFVADCGLLVGILSKEDFIKKSMSLT